MNPEIEYSTLRSEVLKRIELRHTIIALTLTTATAVLGFGITNPTLALLYPPLAMCFCCIWAQNEIRELQLCDYLSILEGKLQFGWSQYYKRIQASGSFFRGIPLSIVAPGSIFILTSSIAVFLGRSVMCSSILTKTLSVINVLAILMMSYLILKCKKMRLSRRSKERLRSNSIPIINGKTPSGLIVPINITYTNEQNKAKQAKLFKKANRKIKKKENKK